LANMAPTAASAITSRTTTTMRMVTVLFTATSLG